MKVTQSDHPCWEGVKATVKRWSRSVSSLSSQSPVLASQQSGSSKLRAVGDFETSRSFFHTSSNMASKSHRYELVGEQEKPDEASRKRHTGTSACVKTVIIIALLGVTTIVGTAIGTLLPPLFIWRKTSKPAATDCGHSSASAIAAGCVMEPLTFAWMSPECQYPEVTDLHTPFKDFHWFRYENMTEPLAEEQIMRGEVSQIWTNDTGYHLQHCLFLYRKLSYALEHRVEWVDTKTMAHTHAYHCIGQLETGGEAWNAVTSVDLAIYHCNQAPWI